LLFGLARSGLELNALLFLKPRGGYWRNWQAIGGAFIFGLVRSGLELSVLLF
jgi:hypothetical protein